MTQANKITIVRIAITPVFFVLFQLSMQRLLNIADAVQITLLFLLLLLFASSELSDLLDGIVARKLNQVSSVGKLMDPFSDVLSRITYFFCFYQAEIMPAYAFVFILWREVSMLFVRQLVQLYGEGALAARWAGKVKAVLYFVSTAFALLVFLLQYWPGSPLLDLSPVGLFCIPDIAASKTYLAFVFIALKSWILPLSFAAAVLASWYSFYLYMKDFLPTLRKQ